MHKALLVGVGKMGLNHARGISDRQANKGDIALSAACDVDVEKLTAFKEKYPDVDCYLVPQVGEDENAFKERCAQIDKESGLLTAPNIKTVVEEKETTALVNVTNNPSHVPVVFDALEAKDEQGNAYIQVLFQEKPFGSNLEETRHATRMLEKAGVQTSMNNILEFSKLPEVFEEFKQQNPDLKLEGVQCSYGKDRTQDTRPATNGWMGMDGIHAQTISSFGLSLQSTEHSTHIHGFLAEGASENGKVVYAEENLMRAVDVDNNTIPVTIEGAFSYEKQMRRVQYFFTDPDENITVVQMEYDKRDENGQYVGDEISVSTFTKDGELALDENGSGVDVATHNGDKIDQYYEVTLNPEKQHLVCNMERSLDLVETVNDGIDRKAEEKSFDIPARGKGSELAPKEPNFADITALEGDKVVEVIQDMREKTRVMEQGKDFDTLEGVAFDSYNHDEEGLNLSH